MRDGRAKVLPIGVRNASTFTGFCNHHDTELFAALETMPFVASDEQLFLLAYRSMCLELFAKEWAVLKLVPTMLLADRGRPITMQIALQAKLAVDELAKRIALESMREQKQRYDASLVARDFSSLRYGMFRFREVPDLACSGAMVPAGDFDGKERTGLSTLLDTVPPTFTISPVTDGGVALFAWLGESPANSALVRSLDRVSDQEIPNALVRYAFSCTENLFMSPQWWRSRSQQDQEALMDRMHALSDPGMLRDDGRQLVLWTIRERKSRLG